MRYSTIAHRLASPVARFTHPTKMPRMLMAGSKLRTVSADRSTISMKAGAHRTGAFLPEAKGSCVDGCQDHPGGQMGTRPIAISTTAVLATFQAIKPSRVLRLAISLPLTLDIETGTSARRSESYRYGRRQSTGRCIHRRRRRRRSLLWKPVVTGTSLSTTKLNRRTSALPRSDL